MKVSALNLLICNQCYSPLQLQESQSSSLNGKEEIISGQLKCTHCPRVFPIVNGVPNFVDRRLSSAQNLQTGQRFGVAWKEFPRLDMRYKEQFFGWISPVGDAYLANKVILEAGCGKGRHANIVADSGAKAVFAIDIGDAVDVAYQNVGHLENVHVIQADLLALPFGPVFDFIFSVGVLHHMDSPALGFSAIVRCLKPDGSICIWAYGEENNWWLIHLVNPLRTAITAKMPAQPLRWIAAILAVPIWLTAKMVAFPYMKLKGKFSWLPPLFYGEYLSYLARFDFTEIHHIVFDHLVAPVSNYIPGSEIKSWFEHEKFVQPVIRWHNKNSWTGFASRNLADNQFMLNELSK